MYALGRAGPPAAVRVGGRQLSLERVVKHDFWAATTFYVDDVTGTRAVVKFGRSQRLLGLPMRWAGRFLTHRESRFYQRLDGVPCVPAWLGLVEGRLIGFAHAFADGQPMSEAPAVCLDKRFFDQLQRALSQLHDRGIAYIDLNKPQNVLVDHSGQHPWLIDFQISYDARAGLKRRLLPRFLRQRLLRQGIRADRYHLLKHKLRRRPDLLTAQEREEVERAAWFIRLHRTLSRPYFFVRRRAMASLRRTGRLLPEGSK
jgi:hypothetical protein